MESSSQRSSLWLYFWFINVFTQSEILLGSSRGCLVAMLTQTCLLSSSLLATSCCIILNTFSNKNGNISSWCVLSLCVCYCCEECKIYFRWSCSHIWFTQTQTTLCHLLAKLRYCGLHFPLHSCFTQIKSNDYLYFNIFNGTISHVLNKENWFLVLCKWWRYLNLLFFLNPTNRYGMIIKKGGEKS